MNQENEEKHGLIHQALCYTDSPVGWVVDKLTKGAQHCYCCSFHRGVVTGVVFACVILGLWRFA